MKNYTSVEQIRKDFKLALKGLESAIDLADSFNKIYAKSEAAITKVRGEGVNTKNSTLLLNSQKLATNFKALQQAQDFIENVDSMIAALKYQVPKDLKDEKTISNLLAQTVKSKKLAETYVSKIYEFLDKVSKKEMPKTLTSITSKVSKDLAQVLKGSYTKTWIEDQVLPIEGELVFTSFIGFKNLKDSNGFIYDNYFITISSIVNSKGKAKYFVNQYTARYVTKFVVGIPVDEKNITDVLENVYELMHEDNFADLIEPSLLPVTDGEELTFDKSLVNKVVVKDNIVTLQLKPKVKTKDQAQAISKDLYEQFFENLKALVPKTKDVIRYRVYNKGTVWYYEFKLTLPSSFDKKPSAVDYLKLKDILGLSQQDIVLLKRNLEKK